jgi:hypothetical protein
MSCGAVNVQKIGFGSFRPDANSSSNLRGASLNTQQRPNQETLTIKVLVLLDNKGDDVLEKPLRSRS